MDEPATLNAFITPWCLCWCSACRLMGGKEYHVLGSVCGWEGPKPAVLQGFQGAWECAPRAGAMSLEPQWGIPQGLP